MINKMIVGNLKMNLTYKQMKKYCDLLLGRPQNPLVMICPTSLYLPLLSGKGITCVCQNMFFEEEGAYTGEVSPAQLKSIRVKHTLVGHSERRKYFGDTDIFINKKMVAAFENGLIPILCIGESSAEKGLRQTSTVIRDQIKSALFHIKEEDIGKMIVAYEPIWAIGTGVVPTLEEIDKACASVHQVMEHYYRKNVKVLYGGSVNLDNVKDIVSLEHVDGVLVGGASVNPNNFIKLIEVVESI